MLVFSVHQALGMRRERFGDNFGMHGDVLEMYWEYFGDALGTHWERFEEALGTLWEALGMLKGCIGNNLWTQF